MIGHWLNRTLVVFRPSTVPDGAGGETVTMVDQGTVEAKVDQPTAQERVAAAQAGSTHSHNVYLLPDADVRRNDELVGDGQTFKVLAVYQPSTPRYSKAECELTQEGT